MILTAVVILNYNGEKLLKQFLPSVILHSEGASVIVVDNGSTDHSVPLLHREFPTVRVIELGENFGFCGGYNRALKQIDAFYYVLLNSDVEVTAGWLSPMVKLLQEDHTIAALQPKILSYHQKDHFEYAGAAGGYIDSLGYPFCRGRLLHGVETDRGQYNDNKQIFWATGACLMIRSSVYHTFNGLDEDFFAHMEEIDLCWRIQRTDYRIFYCGASEVYHVGAGTLGYDNPKKTFLNFRNGLQLLFKHLDTGELLYKLPFRMALDWLAAFVFLASGKTQNFLSVFRAHLDFLKNLRKYYHKRRTLHRHFPWYSRKNVYPGIILAAHYLLRKKVIDVNNPR